MEIDPDMQIYDLKKRICLEFNKDYHIEMQRLVYEGRYLDNERTISECGIQEHKLVVILMDKSYYQLDDKLKETEEPMASTSTSSCGGTTLSKLLNIILGFLVKNLTFTLAPEDPKPSSSSPLYDPDDVSKLIEMGFSQEQANQALQLGENNLAYATNILIHSVSSMDVQSSLPPPPPPTPADADSLDFLRDQTQFDEVQRLFKENPKNLVACLEKLKTSNPTLSKNVESNLPKLLNLFANQDGEEDRCESRTDSETESMDHQLPVEEPQPSTSSSSGLGTRSKPFKKPPPLKSIVISNNPLFDPTDTPEMDDLGVQPNDSEAIIRLMDLGFSNLEAAGALVAFNRDEEKAADFLFSQNDES